MYRKKQKKRIEGKKTALKILYELLSWIANCLCIKPYKIVNFIFLEGIIFMSVGSTQYNFSFYLNLLGQRLERLVPQATEGDRAQKRT